ncbi:MAG: PEP-CTERM sorting domain-containing protein [Thiobacillus sp.]
MENINKKAAIAALGLVAAMLVSAQAAAITYDTNLAGTNVTYHFNQADLGLFGTASIVAGDLVFAPTQFEASTNGANGSSPTAVQTLNITVTANSGYQLLGASLAESGGYALTSGASAFVTGNLTATNIEGTSLPDVVRSFTTGSLATGSSTWQTNAAVTLPTTGWGTNDVVSYVSLSISNQLFTASFAGGTADVWKNMVKLNTVTSPVPEANTYAMMLVGLGLVGFMARRTRASV